MEKVLAGCNTALITPFNEDKSIDWESFDNLVNFQKDSEVSSIIIAGTTGESFSMSRGDILQLTSRAVEICRESKTKIVATIPSSYHTYKATSIIKKLNEIDIYAVLITTPAYVKAQESGLYLHYKRLSETSKHELILYNIPSRTATDMSNKFMKLLCNDFKNINYIKNATESIDTNIELIKNNPSIGVLCANDKQNLTLIKHGAIGTISVLSNIFPKEIIQMIKYIKNNDINNALKIDKQMQEIIDILNLETNPIIIKAILYKLDKINFLEYRLPLDKPNNENYKIVEKFCKILKNRQRGTNEQKLSD